MALKTGYIRAAGYNLVTSATRNGSSVVGIVLGGKSAKRRDRHMIKLLDNAFINYQKKNLEILILTIRIFLPLI